MKKIFLIFGLMVTGLATGCLEKPGGKPASVSGMVFRSHSIGTAGLAANTNALPLRSILALPSTPAARDLTLQKLAATPLKLWRNQLPADAPSQAALFQPLLEDLLSAESWCEVRGPADHGEYALAVQLGEDRATLWSDNLKQALQTWKLGAPVVLNVEGFKGWELKKKASPNLFQFFRAGNWVIVRLGSDRQVLLPDLLKQVSRTGRPVPALESELLASIEADWPRLAGWFPGLAEYPLPPMRLHVLGKGQFLRTELRLTYSAKIPWTFEPWNIPTNIISEPIVSFTVGQGIAPLLSQVKGVPELGLKEMPNQFCSWGLEQIHSLSYATMPIANPSNVIGRISAKLPPLAAKQLGKVLGNFLWNSNRSEIVWRGMPFIVPFVKPARLGGTDYLLAGMNPMAPRTNPPPPELFAQLGARKDLMYYDWEISPVRLQHAVQLYHLIDLLLQREYVGEAAATERWLQDVKPLLGNTITEATLTAPNELTVVRKSHSGFTGFELVSLARWVESAGFPLTFDPPPTTVLRTNQPARKTNSPPVKTDALTPRKP